MQVRLAPRDWLEVAPFTGGELDQCYVGLGDPTAWHPAFLDWDADDQRCLKIKHTGYSGTYRVYTRINGLVEHIGEVTLGTIATTQPEPTSTPVRTTINFGGRQ